MNGAFTEIGAGTTLAASPGLGVEMAVSPDGGTIFLSGDAHMPHMIDLDALAEIMSVVPTPVVVISTVGEEQRLARSNAPTSHHRHAHR